MARVRVCKTWEPGSTKLVFVCVKRLVDRHSKRETSKRNQCFWVKKLEIAWEPGRF